MSLERLYYNDPFSNIVISFICSMEETALLASLQKAISSVPALGDAIRLDEHSALTYIPVGHQRNLQNIVPSDETEEAILSSLMAYPFDLQNGESLRIVYQKVTDGYQVYLCLHHIIGDANSLLLLLKDVQIQTASSAEIAEPIDAKAQYLIQSINKLYPHAEYSHEDYLQMRRKALAPLEISRIVLETDELIKIKDFCKQSGISVTAYLVSEVLKRQQVDTVCLPVDTRKSSDLFGNFVGRIDITRKSVEKAPTEAARLLLIHQMIRSSLQQQDTSGQILNLIHPQFYDDVIFDAYGGHPNPTARRMAKLIGYKDPRPTTFVSNLKQVQLDPHISNLCFYPPHPMERHATLGVVTLNGQMVITVQKVRKESRNE